jgi:16S rRNA pseudouridine516 synthase
VKLDRLIAKHDATGRKRARALIAAGRVRVDGEAALQIDREVDRFAQVELDGTPVQTAARLLHLMLYKPVGVVSATRDDEHPTVLDLIDDPDRTSLHLAGRLDRNTSGLLLLTNDGRWSKALMDPSRKVPKTYWVETADPIPPTAVQAFAAGFHFHTENLITRPALLEIRGERQARLTLHEGRYHQVKRMFHRIGNRVTKLHRESVGALRLPPDLRPGEWRQLSREEAAAAVAPSPPAGG